MSTDLQPTIKKRNGVHFTPPALARFLAEQTVSELRMESPEIRVLDPACGDGALLAATVEAASDEASLALHGLDIDARSVRATKRRLHRSCPEIDVSVRKADFLEAEVQPEFDMVIANPPYVRTQVLGSQRAQILASRFGLKGRVDLYHAFAAQIAAVLKPGGVMGLLTSNRFLSTKGGASLREQMERDFAIKSVFDLGDTRLFDAAVLPVVVVAAKKPTRNSAVPKFVRVYSQGHDHSTTTDSDGAQILAAVASRRKQVQVGNRQFRIDRGHLKTTSSGWTLSNRQTESWLSRVRKRQAARFGDLAEIKVGIKTTADKIFIREDWGEVESGYRPEDELILPLITHHDARRWKVGGRIRKSVLYPYQMKKPKQKVIEEGDFPSAFRYFEQHRDRLASRKYVVDSGRAWFEVWVPHQPAEWKAPKIVWPDISDQPRFFLDCSGAIVNGDCYWIKLNKDANPDWLYLMLAVANSSVATKYYDIMFHNKLYAGRRRFMTQYVNDFPLPSISAELSPEIIRLVKKLLKKPTDSVEQQVETLVQRVFGL